MRISEFSSRLHEHAIFVVGVGYTASFLGEPASASSFELVGLRRRPTGQEQFQTFAADLFEMPVIKFEGKIAAAIFLMSADDSSAESYARTYALGGEAFARVFGPISKKLIYVSSTRVYAAHRGESVNELSPLSESPHAQSLRAGENAVLQFPNGIVLRAGGIYGPGRTSRVQKLRMQAPDVASARFTNRVMVKDLARAIVWCTASSAHMSGVYNLVDHHPASSLDIYRWLHGMDPSEQGKDVPVVAQGKRVSSEKIRQAGFVFDYPSFEEGYKELLGGDS